jgi:hypothetical protein
MHLGRYNSTRAPTWKVLYIHSNKTMVLLLVFINLNENHN